MAFLSFGSETGLYALDIPRLPALKLARIKPCPILEVVTLNSFDIDFVIRLCKLFSEMRLCLCQSLSSRDLRSVSPFAQET